VKLLRGVDLGVETEISFEKKGLSFHKWVLCQNLNRHQAKLLLGVKTEIPLEKKCLMLYE
jgi:hypothetical protein